MAKGELKQAILKGIGRKPTSWLLRWTPTFREPFQFDLVEVMRCDTDGGIVTRRMAQSPRAVDHVGHKLKSPSYFSVLDFLKVQLRIIQ